jgi:hypothetical protein
MKRSQLDNNRVVSLAGTLVQRSGPAAVTREIGRQRRRAVDSRTISSGCTGS